MKNLFFLFLVWFFIFGCISFKDDKLLLIVSFNVLFIIVDDMNNWGVKNYYFVVKMFYFEVIKGEVVNFMKVVCFVLVCVFLWVGFMSGIVNY